MTGVTGVTAIQPPLPPCCAEAEDGVCPQHAQAERITREGPRRRHGGSGHRVIGDSGKAKPVRDQEGPS